ncbi:MAG TPA: TonB-dependent receptor, partial [Burkholderiaceae bacterium]
MTMPSRFLLFTALALVGSAAGAAVPVHSLADLSLEQLGDIVVTSVSRRAESLEQVPASVYVISALDIRRAGAVTLPDALRLAPNLDVVQADANQYAISARGFNNVLANKLLVMIDGRPVYSPLFSGVLWEAQTVMLEDVDRIEVVSGPASTLWGTNAVNGFINVITKPASATQGPAASLHAGTRERQGSARWGAPAGEHGAWRAYAHAFDRSASERADGSDVGDAAHGRQAGFRADLERGGHTLTLQGDAYATSIDQAPGAPRRLSGANLLGRWSRDLGPGRSTVLQVSVEQVRRDQPGAVDDRLDTFDATFQFGLRPTPAQQLVLGAGLRHSRDDSRGLGPISFVPPLRRLNWVHLFAQDEIALAPRLDLTLGTSLEHNPYTGTEVLPSARVGWRASERLFAWAALSHTARAPSRLDRELNVAGALVANPAVTSELADVAELGLRGQASEVLSYSVTAFEHHYRDLRGMTLTPGGLIYENRVHGRSHGIEAWASWAVTPRWKLDAGVVALHEDLHVDPGSGPDFGSVASLGNDPDRWWSLRSTVELTPRWSLYAAVRHSAALPQPAV